MTKVPCEECLVFIQCKSRLHRDADTVRFGMTGMTEREKCKPMANFLAECDIPSISRARRIFGLSQITTLNSHLIRQIKRESRNW
jgi:hypothetical protein